MTEVFVAVAVEAGDVAVAAGAVDVVAVVAAEEVWSEDGNNRFG